jgi:ABC-2 type transport system permease protein
MGAGVMVISLIRDHWQFDIIRLSAFSVTFVCGVLIAYAFMLILTAFSVWLVRNQSLMEMWWLFASLARYPRQIFDKTNVSPIGFVFTFILPILLVANVPSDVMVRTLNWGMVGFTITATVVCLIGSRKFFLHALRSYRSASS